MLLVVQEESFIKKIKQIFQKEFDVIYGYTDIGFSSYSERFKSAIVFAVPCGAQLTVKSYTEEAFYNESLSAEKRVTEILNALERVFIEENIEYYVLRCVQEDEETFVSEFSLKYAAVNAGLGWIGKNDALITTTYGPRVRLSAVLFDRVVSYGIGTKESLCLDGCTKCVDICPQKALTGNNWNIDVNRNDLIDYHLCNEMRSKYIERHNRKNACGLCMIACPFGMGEL